MANLDILQNYKILIVGLGQEGTALATYLVKHGLIPTATDIQPIEKLGPKATSLAKLGVPLVLGGHPLVLLDDADLIFVSPGVPLEIPLLKEARHRKIPLTTETRLFCYLCPAPIYAITGSSGKSTTTTLLGEIMKASGKTTWVGGNIGRPLIDVVDDIKPNDVAVMELSSFQLEFFRPEFNKGAISETLAPLLQGWSPPLSALLNITPNHLDRHPSMRSYVRAKRAIVDFQGPDGVVIMSLDNDVTRTIGRQFNDKVRWFSTEEEQLNGACLYQNHVALVDPVGNHHLIIRQDKAKLLGKHNLSNMMAACLMAREAGVTVATMQLVLASFTGLSHRLELVRELNQVSYYNDSIATTPDRVMAALRSFEKPVVLLVGGRDKKLSWEEATRVIVHKTEHVILFGESKAMIAEVLERAQREITTTQTQVHLRDDLAEAVKLAAELAQPNRIVLLSPGCASYDQFHNFMERGQQFKELVLQLTA